MKNNIQTPQLEKGYTKIADEILEALSKTYMSSYESQILWTILRKTYGWGKKEDWISNSQFVELTGIEKGHVSRTIRKLVTRKIVTRIGNKTAFQKDSSLWCKLPKQATVAQTGNTVAHSGLKVAQMGSELPKQAYTINTIQNTLTKDTIQKTYTDTSVSVGNKTNSLIAQFKEVNPSYERLFANKTQRAAIERMVKKHGSDKIGRAILAARSAYGQPYAPQITTPLQLEQNMGKLIAYYQQQRVKNKKLQVTEI